jgi:preprotein translocase subunit SecA
VLRQVERQVMLRIIDTRWREHLFEMDYLQEGINLRAMGQKDPLTEWQREGYEMFGQMMQGIAQDLLRYVMHVQVQVSEPAKAQAAAAAAQEAQREAAPKEAVAWGEPAADEDADELADDAALEAAALAEEAPVQAVDRLPGEGDVPLHQASTEVVPEPTPDELAAAVGATNGAEPEAADEPGEAPVEDEEPDLGVEIAMPEEVLAKIGGAEADVQILGYSAPEDPSAGSGMSATAAADVDAVGAAGEPDTMTPVRKTEWEKTSRNAPCPCGSGKKYKRCHGAAA